MRDHFDGGNGDSDAPTADSRTSTGSQCLGETLFDDETGRSLEVCDARVGVRLADRMRGLLTTDLPAAQPRMARFCLAETVRDLIRSCRDLTVPTEENIQWSQDIPQLEVEVVGDRRILENTLLNLLINSVEAMPSGGEIKVTIKLETSASMSRLIISDTGQGMDDDTRWRIYSSRFTTKGIGRGAGIGGLPTRIQHCIGGGVELFSKLDVGTIFSLSIPLSTHPLSGFQHGPRLPKATS